MPTAFTAEPENARRAVYSLITPLVEAEIADFAAAGINGTAQARINALFGQHQQAARDAFGAAWPGAEPNRRNAWTRLAQGNAFLLAAAHYDIQQHPAGSQRARAIQIVAAADAAAVVESAAGANALRGIPGGPHPDDSADPQYNPHDP